MISIYRLHLTLIYEIGVETLQPKATVQGLPIYEPGKPLEDVKREFGLTDVIKLASNENPYGCSEGVWAALEEEKEKFYLYPEGNATLLAERLADHLNVDSRQLIFGNGSDEIVQMICRAYLSAGDESVLADPTFSRYETGTLIEGAKPVKVPLRDGVHDLDKMLTVITDKTRIVWICNPNNPSGTIVHHQALKAFLEQIPDNVLVVVDEAYAEYVVDSNYPDSLSLLDSHPRMIILRTFSKIYGLAAFRIGYGIMHPDIVQELHRVREPFNTNRLAQRAAIAALDDQAFVARCRIKNRQAIEHVCGVFDEWGIKYYPAHGNFILFHTGHPAQDAFQFLLKRGIIVRSGQALGFPMYLRVTLGTSEQNERFLEAYSEYMKNKRSIKSNA